VAADGSTDAAPFVREYRLFLDIASDSGAFHGRVDVDLEGVDGPVVLDAEGLAVEACSAGGRPVPFRLEPDPPRLRLEVGRPGSWTVSVVYRGQASDRGLVGLYRSRYGAASILTTQCQPAGARRVFPCLDRPDRKAVFEVEVATDPALDVVFNTPVARRWTGSGRSHHRFARTPPMATYLFYLGIGRFDWAREPDPTGRVELAVAAPPGRARDGRWALAEGRRMLAAYEEYFGIPYPLPKLDLVAVPEHAWGAMENWGAITFREMRLLLGPDASGRQRREAAVTMAHEIAHQWFGNLVTMRRWTDVWLNESFATLMEILLLDRLAPADRTVDDFLLTWGGPSRLGDSLPSTHAVVTAVDRPEEIGEAFDEISYGKGASVLRMLERYVGPEAFRAGVSEYLRRFQYKNSESRDLWAALERASGRPVERVLAAWVLRPGYPVVSAARTPTGVRLRQEPFRLSGSADPADWPIPLHWEVDGRPFDRLWEGATLEVDSPLPPVLNPGARGFFRVRYDDALFDRVLDALPRLPATDRWGILDDLVAFTLAGPDPPDRLLRFVELQRTTADTLIVRALASVLETLAAYCGHQGPIAGAAHEFLAAQWDRLDRPSAGGEHALDGVARERVASARVLLDPAFARDLAGRFDARSTKAPDLAGPVAEALGRVGGAAGQERLLAALADEPNDAARAQLELALVVPLDPTLLGPVLDRLDRAPFTRAHAPQVVRRAALPPEGRERTWTWIRDHVAEFDRAHPGSDFAGHVLQHALPLVGIGRRSEVEAFVDRLALPHAALGAEKGRALLAVTDAFARGWSAPRPDA
jgi:tricorn protease interacting factor F2/3